MEYMLGKKVFWFLENLLQQVKLTQFIVALFLISFFPSHADAFECTLSWDANSDPDIAGYKVYYKANYSGQPSGDYDAVIDVGNVTTVTIEDLEDGTVYFFSVTAYDSSDLESDFSNEVSNAGVSNAVVITLPDAGSTPYLMTKGNDPDSVALYAAGGSISEGFNWSLTSGSVGSLSQITNERTVIYSTPSNIEDDSETATVILSNDAGTLLGQQVITIYKALTITNKLSLDQVVYTGEANVFTVQGGDGSFTWTVTKNGALIDLYSGSSYVFDTVGEGSSGIYTITVTDGNNFSDTFDVDVLKNITSPTDNNIENNSPATIPSENISGYVVDEYGSSIGDADVNLLSPKQFTFSTVTTSDGSFSFLDIPNVGKYHFSASKNGYVSKEFSSDDLLSGIVQNNIILKKADTYIDGEITIDEASFSGEPVEVTISYIENGMGIPVGKTISLNGKLRIDFDEIAGVSEYIVTAARPGEYGQITIGSLPQSGVVININTSLDEDVVNGLAGGSSHTLEIAGQPVSIARIPFGGIAPSSGVTNINIDITTLANTSSIYTSGSGSLLYNIDMDYQDITTILTLPFSLADVSPGDFESGEAVIYHADTIGELISGTNIKQVSVDDIISIDYIGDGTTGLIEFYTDSLSVFGIGLETSSTSSSSSNSSSSTVSGTEVLRGIDGGGSCFITAAAYDSETDGILKSLLIFGFIVLFVFVGAVIARNQISDQKSVGNN